MKRLIATRPVQYMGRVYSAGDALPARDSRMVAAWLGAGSAEWKDTKVNEPPRMGGLDDVAGPVLQALETMGVKITDDAGALCGTEELVRRITDAALSSEDKMQVLTPAHMDPAMLAKLSMADLEKLAADMGVDTSTAKTNTERAELIAAVEVYVPTVETEGTV